MGKAITGTIRYRLCFMLLTWSVTIPLSAQTNLSHTPASFVDTVSTGFSNDKDIIIADFEQESYGAGWEVEGTAFGKGPVKKCLPGCVAASGFLGGGHADSRLDGDKGQGTLTSKEIVVARKYIRFLIAGADFAGKTCINLIHDGRIIRSSKGQTRRFNALQSDEWDVAEFLGKKVRIQIVDRSSAWMGYILVDHILQSDANVIQNHQVRELAGSGKYLLLPISNKGNYWANVTVSTGNEALLKFSLALAADKPDWWAFVNVPSHPGTALRIEVDKLPKGSKGLESIAVSNDATGYTPYQSKVRPQFHYTPRCGFIGDPNGLVYHDGAWHLFYQHNPVSTSTISVLNWGHATSHDLIHWEELPDALSAPLNEKRFLSGSAVTDQDNTSGFGNNSIVAFSSSLGESAFYSTDKGRTFRAWEHNPVVAHAGRDPRVFWYNPGRHWVMVVYDETEGKHRNAIYTSPNLKEWTFQSAVNDFFECPELFELPIDGDSTDTAWLMFGANNQYLLGKFDGKIFTPQPGSSKSNGTYGNCFYAAQTFNDAPDGRRIEMGWLTVGFKYPSNTSFMHMMSVPLELTLHRTADGLKLYSYPVRELERLRKKGKDFPDIVLSNNETIIPNMNGGPKDITVEFAITEGTSTVGIKVGDTTLSFDARANQLSCGDAKAQLKPVDGKVRIRILADQGILEIFANEGLVYMPVAVPVSEADRGGLSVFATGGVVKANLLVYGMRSIWNR